MVWIKLTFTSRLIFCRELLNERTLILEPMPDPIRSDTIIRLSLILPNRRVVLMRVDSSLGPAYPRLPLEPSSDPVEGFNTICLSPICWLSVTLGGVVALTRGR